MKIRILVSLIAVVVIIAVLSTPYEKPLIRSLDFGREDSDCLMRLAQAELGDVGWREKAKLMLTVLNRVWHEDYPNSVDRVIECGDYPSVIDGRYAKAVPDDACYTAIRMIYGGWNESNNALDYNLRRNVSGVLEAKRNGLFTVRTDSGKIELWEAPDDVFRRLMIGEYITKNADGTYSVG